MAFHPENTSFVIRFKNPLEGEVVIRDHVRGEITISNSELDDLIIARSDGTPTYNFCVVVDDYLHVAGAVQIFNREGDIVVCSPELLS